MGAEAYGLIGFFTMLQAWFALLDLGLTPTIGRESARYRGGAMSALAYRQLFRALSLIFASIALIGGCGLWLLAEGIATRWLNISELPMREVILAVQIMAISVALRWMGGLYRGVIMGFERLVWLSTFNAFIATLRFIAVFVSMWLYGFTPFVFFIHQLTIALLEIIGLFILGHLILPTKKNLDQPIGWSIRPVKPILKFSLTIAFTSSTWVFVTQTDKLILSGILPLTEYGYFSLAVLIAGGIMIISSPISNAIMPHMTKLYSEEKHNEALKVYRNATQLVSTISGSAAITIAICAKELLFAWTGDQNLSEQTAPILRLYSIGNGLLVLAAFPYYLQYAKGVLRYHFIGNIIIATLLIPTTIMAAFYYGGLGAGYAWAGINGLYLATWTAYIHYKLEPNLHFKWISKDILNICFPSLTLGLATSALWQEPESNTKNITYILLVGISSLAASIIGSPNTRQIIKSKLQN